MRAIALALLAAAAGCGSPPPGALPARPASQLPEPPPLTAPVPTDVVDGAVVHVDRDERRVQLRAVMRWLPVARAVDEDLEVLVDDETAIEPAGRHFTSLQPGMTIHLEAAGGRAVRIILLDTS